MHPDTAKALAFRRQFEAGFDATAKGLADGTITVVGIPSKVLFLDSYEVILSNGWAREFPTREVAEAFAAAHRAKSEAA